MELRTRQIKQEEIDKAYTLISNEGWNLTQHKFKLFCQLHPQNVYVTVTEDNEIMATVSYFQTFDGEYILCNLVVKDNMRKQGLGCKIVLETLSMFKYKVVQLTALPGTERFYHKLQFKSCHSNSGHEIYHMIVDRELVKSRVRDAREMTSQKTTVVPFEKSLLSGLITFDNGIRGYDNSMFVRSMVETSNVLVTRHTKSHDHCNHVVLGYVAAYLKGEEIVVDGLFADSDDIAILLFDEVLKLFPEVTTVKLQMFASRHFLLKYGCVTSSYTYNRLSLGGEPSYISTCKIYNVTEYD